MRDSGRRCEPRTHHMLFHRERGKGHNNKQGQQQITTKTPTWQTCSGHCATQHATPEANLSLSVACCQLPLHTKLLTVASRCADQQHQCCGVSECDSAVAAPPKTTCSAADSCLACNKRLFACLTEVHSRSPTTFSAYSKRTSAFVALQ